MDTETKPASSVHAQPTIDPDLTMALAQASIAAHADFDHKPVIAPSNYMLSGHWTGWNGASLGGAEEPYGLLFQSTLPGQGKTFIVAFRGTDSDMDAFDGSFFKTVPFVPTYGTLTPSPHVASGFYDIYNARGDSMARSMREQLFALIEHHQPHRIYITGHSLGAALASLFSLDVALSLPNLWATNMNFASPMVGTTDWQEVYEAQLAEHDPRRRTVRVYNYVDYVSALPPSPSGYKHVGAGFRIAFKMKNEWYPHEMYRHSMLNIQTILHHAIWRDPQAWVGTFQDVANPQWLMESTVPPVSADVQWVDRLLREQAFEQSLWAPETPAPSGTKTV